MIMLWTVAVLAGVGLLGVGLLAVQMTTPALLQALLDRRRRR